MRKGVQHIPLYNPEPGLHEVPRGYSVAGYRVLYEPTFTETAMALGFWPFKRIVVGPKWLRLPLREQHAVLLHEAGHCAGWHLERRLLMLPLYWTRWAWDMCIRQEYEADRFVAAHGYGRDLIFYLRRNAPREGSLPHPHPALRIMALER